jgi:Tfp pilus assembly protein PilF
MKAHLLAAALSLLTVGVSGQELESRIDAAYDLAESGKSAEGCVIIRAIIEEEKSDPAKYASDASAQYQLARAFRMINDFKSAAAHAARSTELDPTGADAFRLHGHALISLGRVDEAVIPLLSAIELEPGDGQELQRLGSLLVAQRRPEIGLKLLLRADAEHPDQPDTVSQIAIATEILEGIPAAAPFYERALALDPQDGHAALQAGKAAYLAGDYAKARSLFEHGHSQKSNPFVFLEVLIQVCEASSDVEARDMYRDQAYALFRANDPNLGERDSFVRDQFAVGEKWVFAREYFEYTKVGELSIKYGFAITGGPSGRVQGGIEFGRQDLETSHAREAGKIGSDAHIYAITRKTGWWHATYYLGPEEFDYETVKAWAVGILREERKPISLKMTDE